MKDLNQVERWRALAPLEEPPIVGRRFDVGGFAFAMPFELFLREISADYLATAWQHLAAVLAQHNLHPTDLSWGYMHAGETRWCGRDDRLTDSEPHHFIGWTSRVLADLNNDPRAPLIDAALSHHQPQLRCATTWRSIKWTIGPAQWDLALTLIFLLCTDELTDWSPAVILEHNADPPEVWKRIAHAIDHHDERQLRLLLEAAQHIYSATGFQIVVLGYLRFLDSWNHPLRQEVFNFLSVDR